MRESYGRTWHDVVRHRERTSDARACNLWRLELLVDRRVGEFPERADEWRSYLLYLRNYSDVDGRLPEAFADLVSEVFDLPPKPSVPAVRTPRVLVLIPAHDEEEQIAETIDSVLAQTRPAEKIVVIDDVSTDRTAEIARAKGMEVFPTIGNVNRKAGALNQAYTRLASGFDYILEMDADTTLHPRFLEEALAELEAAPRIAGVCNRFFAKPARGLLRRLQGLEYARYENLCDRWHGRVSVLSGTATVLRTSALPEKPWSEDSLVEDYALTLYLRRNGFEVKAGKRAFAYTDTMPTIRHLWRQRLRWERGTLDELRREGWKPYTRRDIVAQIAAFGAIALRSLWLCVMGVAVWFGGVVSFHPLWLLPLALITAERVVTAWPLGWRARLIAASFVPEELYNLLREAWIVRSAWLSLRGAAAGW